MEIYRFLVSGRVQGVFYRKSIQQAASALQIQGYVRNLDDGRVEVVAFLYDDMVEEFKKILQNGSPLSRVEKIEQEVISEEEADLIHDGFEVR